MPQTTPPPEGWRQHATLRARRHSAKQKRHSRPNSLRGWRWRHAPFAELAARAGTSESAAIDTISRWVLDGVITRFGVIVRHHELGYTSNAMVAFDVSDCQATEAGLRLAAFPEVTLCAQRVRCRPGWPYNIYCMIHGRDDQRVLAQIDTLRKRGGLLDYPFAVLFSRRRFKQQAARIADEVAHG